MVAINIAYQGQLRCEATHAPSGTVLQTDAPKDNNGRGESFSPTDLVATALGSCMLTVMGIAARTLNVDLEGATVTVNKEMVNAPVRRIAKLTVELNLPAQVSDENKRKLEHVAMMCPVHKSLHPDIEMPIKFNWAS
ncbi:MAG: OsmC-like protein [Rickettsiaceae bacterium]|jgi:putative redox protein|nr:OsmC-like protein [Rickettsiaceae bacterium]